MAQVTVDIKHWLLTNDAAMHQCLHDMHREGTLGFRGHVRVQLAPPPVMVNGQIPEDYVPNHVFDLELNDNAYFDRPAVTALVGQVVVYFGNVLQVMSVEEFSAQFGVEP